ncbi:MAG: alginate lyase family protein [Candidatus Sumerlaeota bacterium]
MSIDIIVEAPGRDRELSRLKRLAKLYAKEAPRTIVAAQSPRNPGGAHDYFSEGDYWWPDPADPGGPYIRRDGLSNPENFNEHRLLLRRFSMIVPALTAGAIAMKDGSLANHAVDHLDAWLVHPATRMNPHLQYGQAIQGVCTGRGIGIVDTVHLAEVAVAAIQLEQMNALSSSVREGVNAWFAEFLRWLTESEFGIDERDHGNNHSTCWALQVAAMATLVDAGSDLQFAHDFLRDTLLPQIAADGSMPLELERTRPYNYSFFNLELFAGLAQILSWKYPGVLDPKDKIGAAMKSAFEFLLPYAANPDAWPYAPDVAYREYYPVRWSSLYFFGKAFGNQRALGDWQALKSDSDNEEIQRNTPIRQPLLWSCK